MQTTEWVIEFSYCNISISCNINSLSRGARGPNSPLEYNNDAGDFKECEFFCHCLYTDCKYLRFRSHMPPWFERTLAICYFEILNEYPYPIEVPFITDWIFFKKSRQQKKERDNMVFRIYILCRLLAPIGNVSLNWTAFVYRQVQLTARHMFLNTLQMSICIITTQESIFSYQQLRLVR